MSQQTTIRKLAELVNTPVEKLLEQLSEAGMSFNGPDQVVTSTRRSSSSASCGAPTARLKSPSRKPVRPRRSPSTAARCRK